MSSNPQIDQQLERVDRVLNECERRQMDPVKELEKAVERHDKREQRATNR